MMETTVLYIGWATVIGALALACGWVWYYALFWWFNAIKDTAAMGKFIRMHAISIRRRRAREQKVGAGVKRNNIKPLAEESPKVGAGGTAPEGHNAKITGG